jgi:uncharacterized membrane protein
MSRYGAMAITLQIIFLNAATAFVTTPNNHELTRRTVISRRTPIRQLLDTSADVETEELSAEELERLSKKEIVVSASINLPFSADVAFSAFADLPRQSSWSPWLHSVAYIEDEELETEYTDCGIPLLETKWVMKWKKAFRFSWKSKVTKIERPNVIQWESTSGLRNMGRIVFTETFNGGDKADVNTDMCLEMKFIAPRIVASLLKRSDAISSFMEDQMLTPTLVNFRDIILEDDLGMAPLNEKDRDEGNVKSMSL